MHPELIDNMWVNPGEIPDNETDDDDNGKIDDIHGAFFFYDPPCWPTDPDPPLPPPEGDPTCVLEHYADPHGTRIAGIIAAKPNNGQDLAGICWTAQIMALRLDIPWPTGSNCNFDNGPLLLAAFEYAIENGAKIINFSMASKCDQVGLYELFEAARDAGVLLTSAQI